MDKPLIKISQFEFFKNLTPLEAGIIERAIYTRTFKTGERIVNEGDAGVVLYLIASGEVKVLKTLKNRQVELAVFSEGSFFGELTLLLEQPRSASVVASEPTTLYCLFRQDFMDILSHYPSLCQKFLPDFSRIIMDRIQDMHEELRNLEG